MCIFFIINFDISCKNISVVIFIHDFVLLKMLIVVDEVIVYKG